MPTKSLSAAWATLAMNLPGEWPGKQLMSAPKIGSLQALPWRKKKRDTTKKKKNPTQSSNDICRMHFYCCSLGSSLIICEKICYQLTNSTAVEKFITAFLPEAADFRFMQGLCVVLILSLPKLSTKGPVRQRETPSEGGPHIFPWIFLEGLSGWIE